MSNKLISFVKSIVGNVNKYDVETDLEQTQNYLEEVRSMYHNTLDVNADGSFGNRDNEKLIRTFYDVINRYRPKGVKFTPTRVFIRDMIQLLDNVAENTKLVKYHLSNYRSNTITPSAIPLEQSIILRAVPHLHFITRYAGELINYLIANGIKGITNADTNIPKIQSDKLESNLTIFVSLLFGYARDPKDFKRVVKEVPEVVISPKDEDRLEAYLDDFTGDLAPGLPNNFVGSPIYTIRSIIANWQATKYHESKDMVQLYKLRLNYYESLKEDGPVDAATEKEIAFLQNRVKSLSAKIAKMEEKIQ